MSDTAQAAVMPAPAVAPVAAAAALAIACGVAFALSPLTAITVGLMAWLCWRTARTLDAAERVWFWWIVGAAIALRLAVVAALFAAAPLAGQPVLTLAPDAVYGIERSVILSNLWSGVPLGPHQYREVFNQYGASSFLTALAVVQRVFGAAPNAAALVSVFCHLAASLLLFHALRRRFGGLAAGLALAMLMFWPTLFMWSVSVLREAAQFLFLAVTLVGAERAVQSDGLRGRAGWIALAAAAMTVLQTLRTGSLPIAVAGIAIAAAAAVLLPRRAWLVAALLIALVGGWRAQDAILRQVRLAANRHHGHVMSAGVSYRLLPQRFYSEGVQAIERMTAVDSVRYLAAAAVMFVLVPLPWQMQSLGAAALLPQQLAWYLVVIAAGAGVRIGLQRDRWLTLLLAGFAVAGLIVIAPNSGNIGTLVRHRDMIVPFVIALAAPALAIPAAMFHRSVRA